MHGAELCSTWGLCAVFNLMHPRTLTQLDQGVKAGSSTSLMSEHGT
jgi:hypothetical protein